MGSPAVERTEAQAIADEELMQAAMRHAHERTGSVAEDEWIAPGGGAVVQVVPFVAVTDTDIDAAARELGR